MQLYETHPARILRRESHLQTLFSSRPECFSSFRSTGTPNAVGLEVEDAAGTRALAIHELALARELSERSCAHSSAAQNHLELPCHMIESCAQILGIISNDAGFLLDSQSQRPCLAKDSSHELE